MHPTSPPRHALGLIAAFWGISGFMFIMLKAIVGLAAVSAEALRGGLSTLQWAALWGNVGFMAYSEGYKGFQQSYSPRVAARINYLTHSRSAVEILLAPAFCMGFFNAPKKRIIISCCLLVMIVILVMAFRLLPQPWRGILDAGVVIGLTWGLLATLWYCYLEFIEQSYRGDPEVPGLTAP